MSYRFETQLLNHIAMNWAIWPFQHQQKTSSEHNLTQTETDMAYLLYVMFHAERYIVLYAQENRRKCHRYHVYEVQDFATLPASS